MHSTDEIAALAPGDLELAGPLGSAAPLRLAILGTRGIPAKYGGFETFAARISPLLVERHGLEVTVIGDSSMELAQGMLGAVRLRRSRFNKSQNPLRFYWESLGLAADCADIALVCGTPGGALAFRSRKKLLVATNPDGLESRRAKWARPVQWLFVATEKAATRFSEAVVCDSKAIESYYQERHGAKRTFVAEYGAHPNPFLEARASELAALLSREGLQPGGYHLVVARLEPENSIHVIVEAYRQAADRLRLPLYILCNRPESKYAERILGAPLEGVVFYGSVFETERLDALRAGARSYVHGHTVGGTNPSLLEAMASGNLCLCQDNVFNRSTSGGQALFFKDADELAAALVSAEQTTAENQALRAAVLEEWRSRFTWELIADKYAALLQDMAKSRGRG